MRLKTSFTPPWAIRAALLSAVFLAACDQVVVMPYSAIGEITRSPTRFDGREVKLRGTASSILKLPLTDTKIYRLKDATGEVNLWTTGLLPGEGEEVVVLGRVNNLVILDGQAYGVMIRETKRLTEHFGDLSWNWPWSK
jgi:hypothetical protein